MSQFLINENMKMPAEAVAITGGSILGLLLGGTAECRCTSRLIGSFRPSVRRNAKPRWSWSPVRRESCRRVGPATAERRPIVCIVDDRGIFGPVILHFRILRTGFAWELHGGHHQGSRVGRPHFEVRGAAYSSPGVQRAATKPLCATAARAASLGRYSPAGRVRRLRARRCGGAPGRGKSPEKAPIQSGFCVICRLRRYSSARRRAFLPPRPAFTSKYVLRPIPILAPCSWWEIIAESQAASRRAPRFGATPALEITGNLTTHSSVSSWNSRCQSVRSSRHTQ